MSHIWMTLPTCVHYVNRRGTCGWPCTTRCEKCEKDGKAYIEKIQECDCSFDLHQTRGCGQFSTTICFLCFASCCSSLSCLSFSTRTLQGCGCIYALCLRFRFHVSLLALSSSLVAQFLPFWHSDNEIAIAATALETINLCNYTQLFVTNCIPKQDGCLCTNHTFNCILKRDRNWEHTQPTENTLCEISTL